MHRTPLILALLLQAPAATAQLRSTADSLPPWAQADPAPGFVVRPDSVPLAAVRSLPELLATRVPSLLVERSSGSLAGGWRLRLRGPNGTLGSNEPLVVVDGIRYLSDDGPLAIDIGGQRPSRLDDLDRPSTPRTTRRWGCGRTASARPRAPCSRRCTASAPRSRTRWSRPTRSSR